MSSWSKERSKLTKGKVFLLVSLCCIAVAIVTCIATYEMHKALNPSPEQMGFECNPQHVFHIAYLRLVVAKFNDHSRKEWIVDDADKMKIIDGLLGTKLLNGVKCVSVEDFYLNVGEYRNDPSADAEMFYKGVRVYNWIPVPHH